MLQASEGGAGVEGEREEREDRKEKEQREGEEKKGKEKRKERKEKTYKEQAEQEEQAKQEEQEEKRSAEKMEKDARRTNRPGSNRISKSEPTHRSQTEASSEQLEEYNKEQGSSPVDSRWIETSISGAPCFTEKVCDPEMSPRRKGISCRSTSEVSTTKVHTKRVWTSKTVKLIPSIFFSSKTKSRECSTLDSRLSLSQRVRPEEEIQDGRTFSDSRNVGKGRPYDIDRCKRRFPSFGREREISEIPKFLCLGAKIQMENLADGIDLQPTLVDDHHDRGDEKTANRRDSSQFLYGRRDNHGQYRGPEYQTHPKSIRALFVSGDSSESSEVADHSVSENHPLGFSDGFQEGLDFITACQSSGIGETSKANDQERRERPLDSPKGSVHVGEDECIDSSHSDGHVEEEVAAKGYEQRFTTSTQQADGMGPTDEFVLGGEERSQSDEQHGMASKDQWNTANDGEHPTLPQTDHRCGTPGMGGSPYSQRPKRSNQGVSYVWDVDHRGVATNIKRQRIAGYKAGLPIFQELDREADQPTNRIRQYHCVELSPREYEIRSSSGVSLTSHSHSVEEKDKVDHKTHSRRTQRSGGSSVQTEEMGSRLEDLEGSIQAGGTEIRSFLDRLVCRSDQQSVIPIWISEVGSRGEGNRCPDDRLEQRDSLLLPTLSNNREGTQPNQELQQDRLHFDPSPVARSSLVADADPDDERGTDVGVEHSGETSNNIGGLSTPPPSPRQERPCLDSSPNSKRMLKQARETMEASSSKKQQTRRQKDFQEYIQYCERKGYQDSKETLLCWFEEEIKPKTTTRAVFRRRLTSVDQGRTSSTLGSAIRAQPYNGDPELERYLKGIHKSNPKGGRFLSILGGAYNPQILIDDLMSRYNNEEPRWLRYGAVLAMRTCALLRSQDLVTIRRDSVVLTSDAIGRPVVTYKYRGKGALLSNQACEENYVEMLPNCPDRCPATLLLAYHRYVESLQLSHNALFVELEPPYAPIGSDTLSNLVDDQLRFLQIPERFTSHSLRAMVSEHLELRGVPSTQVDARWSSAGGNNVRTVHYRSRVVAFNFGELLWLSGE